MTNGSLASAFFVPPPPLGTGMVLSPAGDLLLRYGYGSEIVLTRTRTGELADVLKKAQGPIFRCALRLLLWVCVCGNGARVCKMAGAYFCVRVCACVPYKQQVLDTRSFG